MTAIMYLLLILIVVAEAVCLASGWVPIILRGRPKGGMLGPPREKRPGEVLPQPMIFNLQRRDHFSGSRVYYWNQRYFVNDAFFKPGGPVFLLIGGEASADPLWLLDGAMVEYAKTFNAFCVLLEHRFYGKSQPTNDLSLESLTFLNSKQALADIAAFIDDELRIKFNLTNNKLITFGGGYSGSLSAWFKNKYPQMVDGAVASSAPIYMDLDVGSYLATIMDVMGNTSHPACVKETFTATNTIFEWWGQPDKREKMFQMFRLCDKIDHDNLIEPSALYSALADNWQLVAQYNGVNRTFTGTSLNTTETTINTLCGIMTDSSRGLSIQRYADVSNLILEKFGKKCLDYKYQKLISEMKQESLDSSVAEGARQWIYQSCTEFGWFAGSDRGQVPFGPYFALPFNYSCDQCASLFGQEYFCSLEYATNDINRYYGGYRMQLSNVVFPSGTNDPWYPLMFNGTLSSHAQPVVIHGTAHCADLYPSSQNDPPELKQAREIITNMINAWIS